MIITVFGASGNVGQLVVARALEQGHGVTAYVHSHNPFEATGGLRVVTGDISDAASVAEALTGSEAVICCLGSWHTKSKDVVSSGMWSILPAMQAQGITRIITLTGSAARLNSDHPTLLDRINRLLLRIVAPKILKDGERHLQLLSSSSLDWTALRSPIMNNGPLVEYKLTQQLPAPWVKLSRATVAAALVAELDDTEHLRSAPGLQKA